jgi:integrase
VELTSSAAAANPWPSSRYTQTASWVLRDSGPFQTETTGSPIQARLGHCSIRMMLDRYGHLTEALDADVAEG